MKDELESACAVHALIWTKNNAPLTRAPWVNNQTTFFFNSQWIQPRWCHTDLIRIGKNNIGLNLMENLVTVCVFTREIYCFFLTCFYNRSRF